MKKLIYFLAFLSLPNFLSATNYYWVGGTGAWSDYANHWATTSGGTVFHVTIPSPNDDVFFDANSFPSMGDTIYMDTTIISCHDINWSGVTNTPTLYGSLSLQVYGSFVLSPNVNWKSGGTLTFRGTGTSTINTGGFVFGGNSSNVVHVTFDGTGSWELQSSLNLGSPPQNGMIQLKKGSLKTNGYPVNCMEFYVTGTNTTLLLDTSVVTCAMNWALNTQTAQSMDLDADSAFIVAGGVEGGRGFVYHKVTGYLDSDSCNYDEVSSSHVEGNGNNYGKVTMGGGGNVNGNGNTFDKLDIFGSCMIIGSNQYDTLIMNNSGQSLSLSDGSVTTVNDLQGPNGSCTGFASLSSPGLATIIKSSGLVTFNYVQLQNITATGGATFIANNSTNAGNVTGITINSPAPQNLYWVGSTGNWNDVNHWATSSGGTGGSCVPNQFDNVFFDSNSFASINDTVYTTGVTLYCHDMNWSGVTNTPTLYGSLSLQVYGSFVLSPNVNWKSGGTLTFRGTGTSTINTGGFVFGGNSSNVVHVTFDGTGSWELQSSLILSSPVRDGIIQLKKGNLKTNGYPINCMEFYVTGTNTTLLLDTSVVTCAMNWALNTQTAQSMDLDADSAFIVAGGVEGGRGFVYHKVTGYLDSDSCNYDEVSSSHVEGNGNNYGKVMMGGGYINGNGNTFDKLDIFGSCMIIGSNQYDTLIMNNSGQSLSLSDGSVTTVNDLQGPNGSCTGFASLSSPGLATLFKSSGLVTFNYLQLQNIAATGGATFIANNSTNAGNVTGITINSPAPQNLYWVGSTGNWNDVNHWATSSGGAGGSCVPNLFDNVFFDSNSFASINDTVYTTGVTLYCHDMNWSGVTNTPTLYGSLSLQVYGSFVLSPNVNWKSGGTLTFRGTGTSTINTGGFVFGGNSSNVVHVTFDGTGSWELQSSLILSSPVRDGIIQLKKGNLKTNGYPINCMEFYVTGTNTTLLLDTSVVTCAMNWALNTQTAQSMHLDADSAFIVAGGVEGGGGFVYHNVTGYLDSDSCNYDEVSSSHIEGDGNSYGNAIGIGYLYGNGNTFGKLIIPGSCTIIGNNQCDTLILNNPGLSLSLSNNSTTTIDSLFIIQADPGFPTSINCTGTATISMTSGTVCADYLYLQNIHATGGASFYAGDHSVDLGGNTGWNWTRCIPLISNVWPGDCNYDLIADNMDLLNIGVAYGDTGFVRPSASLAYVAQPCQDWYWQFINAVNVKHADCDGNGVVDANDTNAISLNYGQIHPPRPVGGEQIFTTGTDLILQLPATAVAPGSVISAPILLGTLGNPASNIYGIAFTIDYDSMFIQPGSMSLDFSSSWVASSGNALFIQKDFPSDGKLQAAFTRFNHTDISGYGQIGTLNFTVSPTATGNLAMSFSGVKIISHNEIDIPVVPQSTSLTVDVHELNTRASVVLYPNPAKDELNIVTGTMKGRNAKIIITDILGQVIMQSVQHTDLSGRISAHLQLSSLSNGIYFIRIESEKESLVQKFVKE